MQFTVAIELQLNREKQTSWQKASTTSGFHTGPESYIHSSSCILQSFWKKHSFKLTLYSME